MLCLKIELSAFRDILVIIYPIFFEFPIDECFEFFAMNYPYDVKDYIKMKLRLYIDFKYKGKLSKSEIHYQKLYLFCMTRI